MNNDTGIESGARNFGRFWLAMIPWALGIAASVWLGVYIGAHNFRHELSQEERAAAYVGAQERPKEKIQVKIIPGDCATLTRADVNGSSLMMYAQNTCHKTLDYFAWHWQELSPDGTVIKQGYTNLCTIPIQPNDKAECQMEIETDDRAAVLRVWVMQDTH